MLSIRDPVHGFIRADALETALAEIAPLALRYGATEYSVYRSRDEGLTRDRSGFRTFVAETDHLFDRLSRTTHARWPSSRCAARSASCRNAAVVASASNASSNVLPSPSAELT